MRAHYKSKSERRKVYYFRELSVYRQRRKDRRYNSFLSSPEAYSQYSKRFYSELTRLMIKKEFVSKSKVIEKIFVPKDFTFQSGHGRTLRFLSNVSSTMIFYKKDIVIDFSHCSKMNIGPALILQILTTEYQEFREKYNENSYSKISSKLKIIPSKNKKVNRLLVALKLVDKVDEKFLDNTERYLALNLNIGSKYRKAFYENRKGRVTANVVKFINDSLSGIHFELIPKGYHYFDRLITEILGNAEDHSQINRWFVNGVSFLTDNHGTNLVELNFSIVNFGFSIYEGFEETKDRNTLIYQKMSRAYEVFKENNNIRTDPESNYSSECMFTLFGLQEGISRLKFEKESRGNGTMNFIKAFMELGEYGNTNPKYKAVLNIFSGRTSLTCDNKYKPALNGESYVLALNSTNDLKDLPDDQYLHLNKEYFPGTLIQIKLFLNEAFFRQIVQ